MSNSTNSESNWSTKWALIFFGISCLLSFVVVPLILSPIHIPYITNYSIGIGGAVLIGSFFLQLKIYDKRRMYFN